MRRALLAALTLLLALPASAAGHSIVRIGGSTLTYLSADATSLNTLTVRMRGSRIEMLDRTVDGGIDPGTCGPGELTPDANAYIVQVFCPRRPVRSVRIDLGEREDTARVNLPMRVTLLGGLGTDTLRTGAQRDEVQGDQGNDTITTGAGDDTLDGGIGYDRLAAGDGEDELRTADGMADRVACGAGRDRVGADTLDEVGADCEEVVRRLVAPPADAESTADDRTPPRVDAVAAVRQRLGRRRVKLLATSSERGYLAASGFLDVAGISLPLQSDRRRLAVGGSGARLTVRLRARHLRLARRGLRRGRRATIRMWAVGTDLAGNSRRARPVRIRLRR
jgi:hypothetical protein